ncbi:SURF1 family protein [Sphingomicrobium flavum]|uniref:SURF1 family protein n=1 Tax=Sphingomicrobium flavum TaxID=1229164 RepID=UPI0021AD78D7|nr:SURF1 family protein [Sphingomicrobium flavum]
MSRLGLTISTVIVGGAIAVMIALGLWQLERMAWKNALLERYAAAADQPAITYPADGSGESLPLYRRSSLDCAEVSGWRHEAGLNADGAVGYVHVADCRRIEGDAAVEIGWSRRPVAGTDWQGGTVEGTIGPDVKYGVRLVADAGLEGLETSAVPSPEAIPNNHLSYAIQWFAFAAIALIIYLLALRRRRKEQA